MNNKILGIGIILLFFVLVLQLQIVSAAQCNDGVDNDLDGTIDYPADSGCDSATDLTEARRLGYESGCLTDGDKLMDIFGNINYACEHDTCNVCVLKTEIGNYTTLPSRCAGLEQCTFGSSGGGGGGVDVTPPIITLNSPIQNEVYNQKKVLFDLEVNEKADLAYLDNINGRGRWNTLCYDCLSSEKGINLEEGENNITFRARDPKGNEAFKEISFFVDYKEPQIQKTFPKKGFVGSEFEVQFKEQNPSELILHYGNTGTGFREDELDIENDCYVEKSKTYCNTDVNLNDFNGQEIEYWFTLVDIADSLDESKHIFLIVDETAPVINNPSSFWTQGIGRYNKYIYFNINITEENFEEAVYNYIDSKGRWKEKTLCSKLKEGICTTKKSFNEGYHELTISIIDKAGNSIGVPISFMVE